METDDQQVTVDEAKLHAHETANAGTDFAKHLSLLVTTCRQLRLDNINLATQLREMQQRNLTLKSQMDSLAHTVDDLKSSVEVFSLRLVTISTSSSLASSSRNTIHTSVHVHLLYYTVYLMNTSVWCARTLGSEGHP